MDLHRVEDILMVVSGTVSSSNFCLPAGAVLQQKLEAPGPQSSVSAAALPWLCLWNSICNSFCFFFFFMGRRGCEERRRLRFLFPPSEWDCGSISMHSLKLSLLTLPCVRPMEEDVQSVEKCWPRSCTYQRKPDRYNLDRLSSAPLQASHHTGLELHR